MQSFDNIRLETLFSGLLISSKNELPPLNVESAF